MMIFPVTFIVTTFAVTTVDGSEIQVADFIANLFSLENTDLKVLWDFQRQTIQSKVVQRLSVNFGIPVDILPIPEIIENNKEPCPTVKDVGGGYKIPDSEIYIRKQPFASTGSYFNTFFIWSTGIPLKKTMKVLDSTAIADCHQYIDLGVFHKNSKFLFYIDPDANINEAIKDIFESSKYAKHHGKVIAIQKHAHLKIYGVDQLGSNPKLLYLWNNNSNFKNVKDFFGNVIGNQRGRQIGITALPFAHAIMADRLAPEKATQFKKYENYSGFEISMINAIAETLKFKYEIKNPPDESYGQLNDEGIWQGLNSMVINGSDADICLGFIMEYTQNQVLDHSPFSYIRDRLVFAAPMPKPVAKYQSLIKPLTPFVWFSVLGTLIVAIIVLVNVARAEGEFIHTFYFS